MFYFHKKQRSWYYLATHPFEIKKKYIIFTILKGMENVL